MDSKIDNATAARLGRIVKPRLLRTVSIMKNKIDGENLTELICSDELPDFLQPRSVTIREIDTEKTICRAGRVNQFAHFPRVASQRFLAENRQSTDQCC